MSSLVAQELAPIKYLFVVSLPFGWENCFYCCQAFLAAADCILMSLCHSSSREYIKLCQQIMAESTLIFDNGSSTCRAGFAGDSTEPWGCAPSTVFPSIIGRQSDEVCLKLQLQFTKKILVSVFNNYSFSILS